MSNVTESENKLFDVILSLIKVVNLLTTEVGRINADNIELERRLSYYDQ